MIGVSLRCESSGVRAPGEGVTVDVDAGVCVYIVSDDNVFLLGFISGRVS